jgi:hypothetical protein
MGGSIMWRRAPASIVCAVAAAVAAGPAHGFSGRIAYTGSAGPIGAARPLCICVYRSPDLSSASRLGCLIRQRNDAAYDTGDLADRDYYAVGFVDLIINERLDADEPYVIYDQRMAPPADGINGVATGIDFVFGDEHLATPTATAPAPESPTPTATAAETPSPPPAVAGDCDGDGTVSVNELVLAVGIALDSAPLSSCAAADRDGDGVVRIDELIAALNAALAA